MTYRVIHRERGYLDGWCVDLFIVPPHGVIRVYRSYTPPAHADRIELTFSVGVPDRSENVSAI